MAWTQLPLKTPLCLRVFVVKKLKIVYSYK